MEMFTKKPGQAAQSQDDPAMQFIGVPDVVTLPAQLGGEVRKVTDYFDGLCPCGAHYTRHLVLGDVSVAECSARGFLWYRTP